MATVTVVSTQVERAADASPTETDGLAAGEERPGVPATSAVVSSGGVVGGADRQSGAEQAAAGGGGGGGGGSDALESTRSGSQATPRESDGFVTVDGSEIVLGSPIDDNGTTLMIRRVIIIAAVAGTFYIGHFILNLLRGNYSGEDASEATGLWAATSSLLIELSIPACGFMGALYGNRQLTCCFCSCNLFIAIVSAMSFIRLNIRVSELDGNCSLEENIQQRRTCEAWMGNGGDKYLLLSSTISIVLLGCIASWVGNSLYNRLTQEATSATASAASPTVGEVISLTPSTSQPNGVSILNTAALLADEGSSGSPRRTSQIQVILASPTAAGGAATAEGSPSGTPERGGASDTRANAFGSMLT